MSTDRGPAAATQVREGPRPAPHAAAPRASTPAQRTLRIGRLAGAALALGAGALLLGGCAAEPLLHDLPEREANAVLVALDEGGVGAEKARQDGAEGGWTVRVAAGDVARAHRLLAARELPRARPAGLGEVFGRPGMVPTPIEEHARWLHALAGELATSVEAIDGVVEARVHLGLPADDPLRPAARSPGRAAVLLKCRPAACGQLRALEAGLRALVAGAADGLTPEAVAVVIAEAVEPPAPPAAAPRRRAPLLLGLLAAAGSLGLGWVAWRERRRTCPGR